MRLYIIYELQKTRTKIIRIIPRKIGGVGMTKLRTLKQVELPAQLAIAQ
jgi:hypothetical protein